VTGYAAGAGGLLGALIGGFSQHANNKKIESILANFSPEE
jgi:hypothetical protein